MKIVGVVKALPATNVTWHDKALGLSKQNYSDSLRTLLVSKGIWHRFVEFDEPVRTVEQAGKKVSVERIVKSIVLVGSDQKPLLAILPARNRVSYKKIKTLLGIKDVRLAGAEEVLEYSGYPVGGVPPFNHINRVLLDQDVLQNTRCIAGGGDTNKLVEVETRDLVEFLKPLVADFSV